MISVLAIGSLVGQAITGWHVYNDELAQHGEPAIGLIDYTMSGHCLEATFENWD